MKITQLDIRDFGVFQGEKLEDLGSGIVVIGGANRAGKTSLMEILRNIPFGFYKGSSLPPPKFQYDVRCDLSLEDGEEASVLLKGYSSPEIIYKNTKDSNRNKGLYNIDKATYKELFTISLDELNKNTDKEDSNLQSMLLGAGFKHIVKIPSLAKELRGKANVIGGTRGSTNTKMFKPLTANIKKGVEARKKSISMIDCFSDKKTNLLELEKDLILKENELEESNNNIIKMELLKHNYALNENRKALEAEIQTYNFTGVSIKEYNIEKAKALRNQYIKELEQYNKDSYEFEREATKDKLYKELLLKNKDIISGFYKGISGFKEMTKNLITLHNENINKKQMLIIKIKKANGNWVSFEDVAGINCDNMEQEILTYNIEKFKKTELEKTTCEKKNGEYEIQKQVLENQIVTYNFVTYMKKYIYLNLFFLILGLVIFLKNNLLGSTIIVVGTLTIAVYLFMNYSNSKLIMKRNAEVKEQIDNIEANKSRSIVIFKNLDKSLQEILSLMDEYRDILKLDGRIPEEGIKDYFKAASYLKDEISEYYLLNNKLNDKYHALIDYLINIKNLLNIFEEPLDQDIDKIDFENIESICKDTLISLDHLYNRLILCQKFDDSFLRLDNLKNEIWTFLCMDESNDIIMDIEKYIKGGEKYIKYVSMRNEFKIIKEKILQGLKSLRIKKILYDLQKETDEFSYKFDDVKDDNEKLLRILENLYNQYINEKELNSEYDILISHNRELIIKLDLLKNEKQTLKDELRALNSDERLQEYEKDIREARGLLRPLAEKYAVYNTAALLLEKIRERFLVKTKDKLLKGASEVLSEITSGEYKDIIPMDNLMQGDFKTKLQDESIKESSKELSRGTKEQLFLAVRISRIKEMDPKLPVILDDSFVNFDIAHTRNTIKALVELSKSHQIFVLTCHATLVQLINDLSSKAQYYKLEKGKFTKTVGPKLKEYLGGL